MFLLLHMSVLCRGFPLPQYLGKLPYSKQSLIMKVQMSPLFPTIVSLLRLYVLDLAVTLRGHCCIFLAIYFSSQHDSSRSCQHDFSRNFHFSSTIHFVIQTKTTYSYAIPGLWVSLHGNNSIKATIWNRRTKWRIFRTRAYGLVAIMTKDSTEYYT